MFLLLGVYKMAKLTAAEFQEKHARRLSAAIPDVQKGIDRVTENPCEKAAAKQEKMIANLTESVRSGKWAAGLKRVDLASWKKAARDVGAARITAGINAAKEKVIAFATDLLRHEDTLKSKVDSMPDVTLEDNINRMIAWSRGMSEFKRTT
jgi:hypothetical protein